jgi:hypothetical protein
MSFKLLGPIRFFNTHDSENEFAWPFDTLKPLHRLNQSRSIRRPEDKEYSGSSAYTKQHLSNFVQVAFFDYQDAEKGFPWSFDILKHRIIDFTKVDF